MKAKRMKAMTMVPITVSGRPRIALSYGQKLVTG